MKVLGFFLAIFLSMLAVFLLVTGEVKRWFSADTDNDVRLVTKDLTGYSAAPGTNTLEFDFWNVKLGRRNFTIRAVLDQDESADNARFDELEEIRLKDGIIEIPVYDGKSLAPELGGDREPKRLEEVLLEFRTAVYRRAGGLASGKGKLEILLSNGKGTTNDGTSFQFQELTCFNDPKADEKSAFQIESRAPVVIDSRELIVESRAGLSGTIREGGIEKLVLLPPVYTYLDRAAAAALSGDPAPIEPPPPGQAREVTAVVCQGPLELDFRPLIPAAPEKAGAGGSAPRRVAWARITYQKDVIVYGTVPVPRGEAPAPPAGSFFKCQRLVLDVDLSSNRAVPTRAVASWEGGRVQAHIVRGPKSYVLEGDELLWRDASRPEDGSTPAEEAPALRLEAVLKGNPVLKGEGIELNAQEAIYRATDDLLLFHQTHGKLRSSRPRSGSQDGPRQRSAEILKPRLGAAGATVRGTPGAERGPGQRPGAGSRGSSEGGIEIEFDADEVEVALTGAGATGSKQVARLVARDAEPLGVVVRGRTAGASAPGDGDGVPANARPDIEARGQTLTYDDAERLATLEGSRDQRPQLTMGASHVEARKIHVLRDERVVWFEDDVRATMELKEFRARAAKGGARGPAGADAIDLAALDAGFLSLEFDEHGKLLEEALARAGGAAPLELKTLAGPHYRLQGMELHLVAAEKRVQLWGTPEQPAAVEFAAGRFTARTIRFDEGNWRCDLEGDVDVRLYAASERAQKPEFELHCATASFELLPGFEGLSTEPALATGEGAASPERLLARLQGVKRFSAAGAEGDPLRLVGKRFTLRATEAGWSAETGVLRFFGPGMQEISVDHGQLRGPVRAREVSYDARSQLLTLSGAVSGALQQQPLKDDAKGPARPDPKPSRSLSWEFETSVLEVSLKQSPNKESGAAGSGTGGLNVDSLVARDKVLLMQRDRGIQLRGDDLHYSGATRRLRVYSNDGRPQTLLRTSEPAKGAPAGPASLADSTEPAGPVDKILAQEIWASFHERTVGTGGSATVEEMVAVQFRGDVIATFHVPDRSLGAVSREAASPWKIVADLLTVHVDRDGDGKGRAAFPWALATSSARTRAPRPAAAGSSVVITSGPYQATSATAEYVEAERRIVLVGTPASIAEVERGLRESSPVIVISKPHEKVIYDKVNSAPGVEPWPGVPPLPPE